MLYNYAQCTGIHFFNDIKLCKKKNSKNFKVFEIMSEWILKWNTLYYRYNTYESIDMSILSHSKCSLFNHIDIKLYIISSHSRLIAFKFENYRCI